MTVADWWAPEARSIALYLDGADAPGLRADGSLMIDDDCLLLVNAWWELLDRTIPPRRPARSGTRSSTPFDPVLTELSGLAERQRCGPGRALFGAPAAPPVLLVRVRRTARGWGEATRVRRSWSAAGTGMPGVRRASRRWLGALGRIRELDRGR